MGKKYLLHDLTQTDADRAFAGRAMGDWVLISAAKPAAKCVGCFRCWLKNPGKCTFADHVELLGSEILTAQALTIVCRSLYGGYSPSVKRLMDRVIPGVLPFFQKREGELHHSPRYPNEIRLKAIFYNGGDMSNQERAQAEMIVKANGLNFHSVSCETSFVDGLDKLREVAL